MNISQLKQSIINGDFDSDFSFLYGDYEASQQRYINAVNGFAETFGEREEIRLFSAPGRTEVGGNHTDHQHGSVIAAAVNLDIIAVVALNGSDKINVKSEGFKMDTISVSDFEKCEKEKGRSISLIKGVCAKFKEAGCDIKGFDAYTTSNVLKGSGLSSSAAFEVLISTILNGLFYDNNMSPIEVAKISQFAEREYFGKPCGLLDQTASSLGGFTFADFDDPSNPTTESINLDVSKFGFALCVVDTGGNHANLTGDYADITIECKKISNALGAEFLRYIDEDKFFNNMSELRKTCGDRSVLRAFHFINEQKRVYNQVSALKEENFEEFLRLVNESGNSSYDYLQNLYSTSNVNEQGLSLAIALTRQFLGEKGACRVHGGGFAGTIQCYIPIDMLKEYKGMIEKVFGENSCSVLNIRSVGGYEIKN